MRDIYDALKTLSSGRVYPLTLPDNCTFPALVYTPITSEKFMDVKGPANLERTRVQVDAYAKTYDEAWSLQDDVLTAMTLDFDTVADVRMGLNDFEETTRLYRVSFDYTIHR